MIVSDKAILVDTLCARYKQNPTVTTEIQYFLLCEFSSWSLNVNRICRSYARGQRV